MDVMSSVVKEDGVCVPMRWMFKPTPFKLPEQLLFPK
jgi:hypothetical protein